MDVSPGMLFSDWLEGNAPGRGRRMRRERERNIETDRKTDRLRERERHTHTPDRRSDKTSQLKLRPFRLPGQINHILPYAFAALMANFVAKALDLNIFNSIIRIKKLPYRAFLFHFTSSVLRFSASPLLRTRFDEKSYFSN